MNIQNQSEEIISVGSTPKQIEEMKTMFDVGDNIMPMSQKEHQENLFSKCISCSDRVTKTDNTLCLSCWSDAEGENPDEVENE